MEMREKGKKNKNNEYISRMVVFIYEERAVVMTWALMDDNLVEIMKALRKNLV